MFKGRGDVGSMSRAKYIPKFTQVDLHLYGSSVLCCCDCGDDCKYILICFYKNIKLSDILVSLSEKTLPVKKKSPVKSLNLSPFLLPSLHPLPSDQQFVQNKAGPNYWLSLLFFDLAKNLLCTAGSKWESKGGRSYLIQFNIILLLLIQFNIIPALLCFW